jgi:hypothetical protein
MVTTQIKPMPTATLSLRLNGASAVDYGFNDETKCPHARTPYAFPVFLRIGKTVCAVGLLLNLALGWSIAWAFDLNAHRSRAEVTLAEFNDQQLPDSRATWARLDEMIAIGSIAMKEYGTRQPEYAKRMSTAIADSQAMKGMTDAQLEENWEKKAMAATLSVFPRNVCANRVSNVPISNSSSPRQRAVHIHQTMAVGEKGPLA